MLTILATWKFSDPGRFFICLGLVALCGLMQMMGPGRRLGFPLSVPIVLLAIVELNLPESVAVGCAAAVFQVAAAARASGGMLRILYHVGAQAMMIATTRFALDSLLPAAWTNVPVQLLVAAVALFVANTFPSAIVVRLNDRERLVKIWRDSYLWALPHYFVAAALAHLVRLGPEGVSWEACLLLLPALLLAYRQHRIQKAQMAAQEKHAGDMAALHLRAIEGLALAVEAKDNPNTSGHLRRVQVYSLGIGRAMGLCGDDLEALHAASLLHDIGKLAVPDHILTKPGKLTPEEFAKLKVHPLVGAEIVEQVQFPYPVAPIVRAHHEKWDGSGYPFGLKAGEIPLGARILAAVDCLDALTSDREYRKATTLDDAVRYVVSESGRSFDPEVVQVLERIYSNLDQEVKRSANRPLLSTGARVEKGEAPDAGLDFEELAPSAPAGFLSTIAAARREEQQFRELATSIGQSLDLEHTLQRLHELLHGMLNYDALAFFIRQANSLRVEFAAGAAAPMLFGLDVGLGEGLTGWVAQQRKPVVNGNPAVDPGFEVNPRAPLESALSFPLIGSTDGLLAVLSFYRESKDAFSRDDLRILSAVAPSVTTAVEHAMRFKDTEALANRDPLTGLPNEEQVLRLVKDELSRSRRSQQPFAVAVMKLSEGPLSAGAEAGDTLPGIAQALRRDCRDKDHVGYVEPLSFAFVLPGMKSRDLSAKLGWLAGTVASAAGGPKPVKVHGGGAFYPEDGDSPRQLLALAVRRATVEVQPANGSAQWAPSVRALDEAVGGAGRAARGGLLNRRR
jgi:putative nucleotidyltransferase with HDIG domain